MGGIEQREVDEILPLDEAADRRLRGDDQQRVAGIGIEQPVQQAGIGAAARRCWQARDR